MDVRRRIVPRGRTGRGRDDLGRPLPAIAAVDAGEASMKIVAVKKRGQAASGRHSQHLLDVDEAAFCRCGGQGDARIQPKILIAAVASATASVRRRTLHGTRRLRGTAATKRGVGEDLGLFGNCRSRLHQERQHCHGKKNLNSLHCPQPPTSQFHHKPTFHPGRSARPECP